MKTTKTRWKSTNISYKTIKIMKMTQKKQNVTQTSAKLLKVQTALFVLRAVCVSLNSITSILRVSIVSKIKRKHKQEESFRSVSAPATSAARVMFTTWAQTHKLSVFEAQHTHDSQVNTVTCAVCGSRELSVHRRSIRVKDVRVLPSCGLNVRLHNPKS